MATSSITKDFIITDRKVFDKLIKEINSPTVNSKKDTSYLEDGKKALSLFSSKV